MARLPQHPAPHLTLLGRLAYYLAAWLCGALFFSVTSQYNQRDVYGNHVPATVEGFFITGIFTLLVGLLPLLVFGFLLQTLAHLFRWRRAWEWMLIGGVVTILFSASANLLPRQKGYFVIFDSAKFLQQLFALGGENGIPLLPGRSLDAVLTIFSGMAVAYVLFRIEQTLTADESSFD